MNRDPLEQTISAMFAFLAREAEQRAELKRLADIPRLENMEKLYDMKIGELIANQILIIQPNVRAMGFYLVSLERGKFVVKNRYLRELEFQEYEIFFANLVKKYNPVLIFVDRSGFAAAFYRRIENMEIPVIPLDYERLII